MAYSLADQMANMCALFPSRTDILNPECRPPSIHHPTYSHTLYLSWCQIPHACLSTNASSENLQYYPLDMPNTHLPQFSHGYYRPRAPRLTRAHPKPQLQCKRYWETHSDSGRKSKYQNPLTNMPNPLLSSHYYSAWTKSSSCCTNPKYSASYLCTIRPSCHLHIR